LLVLVAAAAAPAAAQSEAQPRWDGETPSKFDWVQLTSGEWLKGEFLAYFDEEVEFDSAEMELQTFDWEDVQQVRSGRPVEVGLIGGDVAVGRIVIVGKDVEVFIDGGQPKKFSRDRILSITPTAKGKRHLRLAGKFSLGLTVLAGNVDQVDSNVSGYLKRRSVGNRMVIDFIGTVSSAEGTEISNNQRIKGTWDHFITDRFFIKAAVLEFYRDPFLNLDLRSTAGSGVGYQIINTSKTEWEVSGGLGYQNTRFSGVEEGEDISDDTIALLAGTNFERKLTKILEVNASYTFQLTDEKSGRYSHHAVGGFEIDWTDLLDFDVTVVWDRTENPQAGADGIVPEQDDFRLVVAVGVEF
jgi:hypothetical protein